MNHHFYMVTSLRPSFGVPHHNTSLGSRRGLMASAADAPTKRCGERHGVRTPSASHVPTSPSLYPVVS